MRESNTTGRETGGRSRTTRRRFLQVVGGTGVLAGFGQSSFAQQRAVEEDDPAERGTASFEENRVVQQVGDVAEFTVELEDEEEARVQLGSEELLYLSTFTVVDGDGDGQVTVAVDAVEAGLGDEPGISAVGDADEVTDFSLETGPLGEPLDPALYDLRLFVGDRMTDIGALVFESRGTESITVGTAPRFARPQDEEAFFETVTGAEAIAVEDWGVVQVSASGLGTSFADLADLLDDGSPVELVVEETNVMNRRPERVDLADATLFDERDEDRFSVAFDTAGLRTDQEYEARFTVTEDHPYVEPAEDEAEDVDEEESEGEADDEEGAEDVDEGETDDEEVTGETVATTFTLLERSASFDGDDDVRVPPTEDATVSGTATVAPGTEIIVELESRRENPFLVGETTTVEEDGTWSISVDLSDVEEGTEFTARVIDLSDSVSGVVETPEEDEETE